MLENTYHHDLEVVVLRMVAGSVVNYNYLVIDTNSRQALIVDPAWEMTKIEFALYSHSVQLKGILITHSHHDHLNLAEPLSKKYNVPIWMSQQEIGFSNYHSPNLESIQKDSWCVGALNIVPMLTPGHTPGCICYEIGGNIFTGDVLFAEGCGLVPDLNAAHDMFHSLEYLKSKVSKSSRIYPGHSYGKKPGQLFSDVLDNNIYLNFNDKNSFAAFRLRKNQAKSNIFNFR